MNAAAKAAMATILQSPMRHLENCVSWVDDNGQQWAGPLKQLTMDADVAAVCEKPEANTLQERCERAIEYAEKLGIPCRIIALKGRRSGCSLGWAAIVNHHCRKRRMKALVMADLHKRSDEIFSFVRDFATSDVTPWGFGAEATATKVRYGNGSSVTKETAADPNAGRGGGFRFVWFSEAAHFPSAGERDARRLMVSTLSTIPQKAGTVVVAESTANGPDNWFAETWRDAVWPDDETYWQQWESANVKKPDMLWIRVFAAWFEIPRNAIVCAPEEAAAIFDRLSKAERFGVEKYGWTAEQLKWRRQVIASNFSGDEKNFDQEYPHSPDSAFLTTGSAAFNREAMTILRTQAERAVDQWQYGCLDYQGITGAQLRRGETRDMTLRFSRTPREEAWFAMIEPPADGLRYLFTIDPATEAEMAGDAKGLDRMSCLMLRAGYRKFIETSEGKRLIEVRPRIVARIMPEVMEEHPDGEVWTNMAAAVCHLYGNPCTVVELNKGEAVLIRLRTAGINLYRTMTSARSIEQKTVGKYGWTTTKETRHTVVKGLQSLVHGTEFTDDQGNIVREPGIDIEDLHTIREMEHFIRNKDGRYEAGTGHHDDDVLNLAIGTHLLDSATTYRAAVRRRRQR